MDGIREKECGARWRSIAFALVWLLCSLTALLLWPVDVLEIHLARGTLQGVSEHEAGHAGGNLFFSEPLCLGEWYETAIIHSVQLTPVVDRYLALEGALWGWQERIKSHNAGLPSLAPPRGRFFSDGTWMIVEGALNPLEEIYYRVGNRELGVNTFFFPGLGCALLWQQTPDCVLHFGLVQKPLWMALSERGSTRALDFSAVACEHGGD